MMLSVLLKRVSKPIERDWLQRTVNFWCWCDLRVTIHSGCEDCQVNINVLDSLKQNMGSVSILSEASGGICKFQAYLRICGEVIDNVSP